MTSAAGVSDGPDTDFIIVDDDTLILELVRRKLKRSNVGLKCFTDPGPALDYLEDHVTRVLIVDQRMPRMDGLEMLARLKARPSANAGSIFICSAAALSPEDNAFASGVGAVELSKDALRSESRMLDLLNPRSQAAN